MIPNILLSSSEDNSIPIANFPKITANIKEYICMEAYMQFNQSEKHVHSKIVIYACDRRIYICERARMNYGLYSSSQQYPMRSCLYCLHCQIQCAITLYYVKLTCFTGVHHMHTIIHACTQMSPCLRLINLIYNLRLHIFFQH